MTAELARASQEAGSTIAGPYRRFAAAVVCALTHTGTYEEWLVEDRAPEPGDLRGLRVERLLKRECLRCGRPVRRRPA